MQRQTRERQVMSRRLALRWLGGLTLGLSAAACTPVRIVFRMYPKDFDDNPELVDAVLRGFVTAVGWMPCSVDSSPPWCPVCGRTRPT
jgi:cytochrome c biogenesis protein CcdA